MDRLDPLQRRISHIGVKRSANGESQTLPEAGLMNSFPCSAQMRVLCVTGLLVWFVPTPLRAQTLDGASGFVSGRAGVNFQAVPDGVSGASVGAGASLAAFINSHWAVEFEAWVPDQIEDAGVRNRVLLFSGNAIKFFSDGRRGPYMLFGLTAARIEFGSSSDFAGGIQLGVGGAIRLSERTSIAPELRLNLIDGGMFLIRPNVGFLYTFH